MTPSVASALIVTLLIEVPIVALVYARQPMKMAIVCTAATAATNLLMNIWLLHALGSYDACLVGGEIGATAIEAAVYAAFSRDHDPGRALIASGLANAASFAVGLVVF